MTKQDFINLGHKPKRAAELATMYRELVSGYDIDPVTKCDQVIEVLTNNKQ